MSTGKSMTDGSILKQIISRHCLMQAQFNYSACLIFLVFYILQRSDCTKTVVFLATFTHIWHLKSCSVLFSILDSPLEF